jgi:hypothetical protein
MKLALGATAIVLLVLIWELAAPRLRAAVPRLREAVSSHRARSDPAPESAYDPGRELRAEQRARALLRSCVNQEDWEMYRDLGFLRVWGRLGSALRAEGVRTARDGRTPTAGGGVAAVDAGIVAAGGGAMTVNAGTVAAGGGAMTVNAGTPTQGGGAPVVNAGTPAVDEGALYAYLIYPHKPIVAYLPQTRTLLNEYCVAFPDHSRPFGSSRLPDSDDVLAKWMALSADERRLIADANMHLPGRQIDPEQVHRDLARLARWESERSRAGAHAYLA